MPLSGRLTGRCVKEYLEYIYSDNILKKTLGIAALNALSASCWDSMPEKDYVIESGKDAFDDIEIDTSKNAVVVGALAPVIKKLIAGNVEFHISRWILLH
jgi:uncharacterized protein (DUF4213/DUF364 family)